jgi:polysaccharide export outer membrane protein
MISITVLVAGKKEIEESAKPVSDIGTINLPLLGSVTVRDMTLDMLSATLTDRYRKYFVAPHVLVEFDHSPASAGTSPWGYATILGRVKAPGRIAIPPTRDLTISGIIQRAGGFGTSAKTGAILITRRTPEGQAASRELDFNAVGAGGRLEDDILIEADDVIFVPESKF